MSHKLHLRIAASLILLDQVEITCTSAMEIRLLAKMPLKQFLEDEMAILAKIFFAFGDFLFQVGQGQG